MTTPHYRSTPTKRKLCDPINLDEDSDSDATITNDPPPKRRSPQARKFADPSEGSVVSDRLGSLQLGEEREGTDHSDVLSNTEDDNIPQAISIQDLDDYMSDTELEEYVSELRRPSKSRQPERHPERRVLDFIAIGPHQIRPGKTVELSNGQFLRVGKIYDDNDGPLLWGWKFTRSRELGGLLIKKINELCMMVSLSADEFARGLRMKEVLVPVQSVVAIRRLILTNLLYEDENVKTIIPPRQFKSEDEIRAEAPLFCRWILIDVEGGLSGKAKHSHETILTRLRENEADRGHSISHSEMKSRWRGVSQPGGSYETVKKVPFHSGRSRAEAIDLSSEQKYREVKARQYLLGDCFCGCGGVSSGVSQAGEHIRVKWGVDFDQHAIKSYNLNFPTANAHFSPAHMFTYESDGELRVDILHCSPPCQPFSPCHTIAAPHRDEPNQAALFTVWELIIKCKPRVVTMEETSGLIERHQDFFTGLIHVFTALHYDVQWKVLNFLEYGVPQPRRRLIIIASCPGEPLPPYPKPTHGPRSNSDSDSSASPSRRPHDNALLPFVTINDAIADIGPGTPNHDPQTEFPAASVWPQRPYDGNSFSRTITCGAVGCSHPSGRPFTARELACLQTFPIDFKFSEKCVKKQIGNAWSPVVVRAVYREIVKSMRTVDGLEV